MRQGLFAIVLVLAAFAGGALINGPGLEWVQQRVRPSFGGDEGAADADDEYVSIEPVESSPPETADSADAPALAVASTSPFAAGLRRVAEPRPDHGLNPADVPPRPVRAPSGPSVNAEDLPTVAEAGGEQGPAATAPSWPDAPDSAPATAFFPERPTGPARVERASERGRDPDLRLVAAAESDEELPEAGGDWSAVRARMRELGIGHFWIEGEPGGDVRFRCLVPVLGDRLVSQHFEALGPDAVSAARDALRRVALWRATEGPR